MAVIVVLGGSAVSAGATARHNALSGVVTSVNGVSVAGTCGSPAGSGDFTVVTGRRALAVITVEVTTSTTFSDRTDTAPSFADICVASHVKALGTFSSGTLSASSVSVLAPRPRRLNGIVTSVNGVSAVDTCGAATTAGNFHVGVR
jgi:hypothetical protein